MPASTDHPLHIFVSYAPEDRALASELLKHLRVLERHGRVEMWSVDRVRAGDDWRHEVRAALERAHMALLLLSIDFLISDFIQDVEVPRLLERRASQGLTIIPVVLRTCLWEEEPRVGHLRPLPASGKAIAAHEGDARDQVMTEVAREIVRIAKERRTNAAGVSSDNRSQQRNPDRPQPSTDRQPSAEPQFSLGLADFFAIYAVRRYLYKAKVSEAKNTLGAIARALVAYMERENEHGKRADRFPPSAPPIPPEIPCGTKAVPDEKLWNHPTWRAIKFMMSEAVYFSYEIETSPDGRTAVARARGDLSGDGNILISEKIVTLDPAGNAVILPDIIMREESR